MSVQEVSPEQLAEFFYDCSHRALADDDDFARRGDSTHTGRGSISEEEKARVSTADRHKPNSRRYFAKPGEAEWGC